ncbi:MAG: tetratricopeptide repeat protein [Alistipes sp.]|nr:tetratricopeptide repeat protein [Alistipes sp.]
MLRLLLLLLSLVGLVACRGNQELHARLESISALMEEHPDSALHLLEELPADRFRRSRLRADRGLLYTMALDKNYIDSDNDSLIRYTYDYYRRHKATDSVRHLVHYYYGRIRHNDEQYTAAAVEYLEALRLLDTIQSPYRAGLLFSRLGEMYRDQYNFESALGYFYRAHAAYERAKNLSAVSYAMASIGRIYRSMHIFNEAERWYLQSLDIDRANSDNFSANITLSNLLVLYYESANKEKFLDVYNELQANGESALSALDHIVITDFLIDENNLSQAKQHLSIAAAMGYEGNEPLYYLMQFKLASAERDYEKANYYQYRCINANDSLIRNTYSTSVATAEKQFYAERSAFAEYRLRIRKTAETILALAIIALAVVGVRYFRKRIRHKEQQIFDYMAAVDQMQEQYNRLQQTVMAKEQGEDTYKSILAERFSTLDTLCRSFFERDTPHQQQAQLFREVKGRLQALAEDPRMAAELDRVINARFEHLMVRLVEQMPQLSAEDVHFLRLTYAGFSAQVISLIFHDSVQNIYARKYRIKKRIQHSSAVDKTDFINALH